MTLVQLLREQRLADIGPSAHLSYCEYVLVLLASQFSEGVMPRRPDSPLDIPTPSGETDRSCFLFSSKRIQSHRSQ